jgi:hypothetical protein
MGYIQGEGRNQGTLFPVVLDDFVLADHVCRVIDAFVEMLEMSELGFERARAAETGRPGYDPRDLLKLYLYGYLNQIRSSRRLEAECRRNVELMWLLGRLYPDHKSIAERWRGNMTLEAHPPHLSELANLNESTSYVRLVCPVRPRAHRASARLPQACPRLLGAGNRQSLCQPRRLLSCWVKPGPSPRSWDLYQRRSCHSRCVVHPRRKGLQFP